MVRQLAAAGLRLNCLTPLVISTGHSSDTGVGLDALLELLVDLNNGIADLVDLIALPPNRKQHLAAPAPPAPAAMFSRA